MFPRQQFLAAQVNSSSNEAQEDIQISDSCAKRLQQISSDNQPYLRILVEGGGCSGFQYKFDLDSTVNEDDRYEFANDTNGM